MESINKIQVYLLQNKLAVALPGLPANIDIVILAKKYLRL